MRTERTNFEGSWEDVCDYCGKPQIEHRKIYGPIEGMIYEHRLPCEPEIEKMRRERRKIVRASKVLVLVVWILIPLLILILGVTSPFIGAIAFAVSLGKLGIEAVKFFGNPDKWIPGHKEKREREQLERHYIYHCDKNPKGFARLRAENLEDLANDESVNEAEAEEDS